MDQILRYFSAISRASLELLRLDPVTMSLVQPTCRARSTTPSRSSSCRCFPLYTPRNMGSARLIPIWGRSGHRSSVYFHDGWVRNGTYIYVSRLIGRGYGDHPVVLRSCRWGDHPGGPGKSSIRCGSVRREAGKAEYRRQGDASSRGRWRSRPGGPRRQDLGFQSSHHHSYLPPRGSGFNTRSSNRQHDQILTHCMTLRLSASALSCSGREFRRISE